jgi:hypothetical protein
VKILLTKKVVGHRNGEAVLSCGHTVLDGAGVLKLAPCIECDVQLRAARRGTPVPDPTPHVREAFGALLDAGFDEN